MYKNKLANKTLQIILKSRPSKILKHDKSQSHSIFQKIILQLPMHTLYHLSKIKGSMPPPIIIFHFFF